MNRSPEESAVLIALLLKRSGLKRARLSEKTIRRLSTRSRLRHVFVDMLAKQLEDLGLILVELDRGGYGIIPTSGLEGAPAITAKKYLEDELTRLKRRPEYLNDLRAEVMGDLTPDDDDA